MIEIKISKEWLLEKLQSKGYTITVTTIGDSKSVVIEGRYSLIPYKLSKTYSLEFSDHQVQLDCVLDTLRWSGLKITTDLSI